MYLLRKATVIVGMKGSGKSVLAHNIAEQPQYKAVIYDTIAEFPYNHDKYDVYRPHDRYSIEEFKQFIAKYIKGKYKYNLLLVDEANRFVNGGGKRLDKDIMDLNDIQRHEPYRIGTVWIARRPTQLHADIIGLADNVVCFLLTGNNDVKYLNDLKRGLGDSVSQLPPYHGIIFSRGQVSPLLPLPVDELWKKREP